MKAVPTRDKPTPVIIQGEQKSLLTRVTAWTAPLASVGLVALLVVFMLFERVELRNRLIRLVGYGRRAQSVQRDVVLCVDQSGSMAASVVYSSVFSAVLASIRALKTSLVVFDTAVVDLTEQLADPVDVLFGTQLGGGTDINRAIAYGQQLITRPRDTIFVLISDLYEGGVREEMLRRVGAMLASGVQVIVLLALSDEGAPDYDRENATALAALGAPAFACTPDVFPELMAAAIERRDLRGMMERQGDAAG